MKTYEETYKKIEATSNRLLEYMRSRASTAGVTVNPVNWDERTKRLAEVIYAEDSVDRSFWVYPNGNLQDSLHGFVKRAGINRDNILVGIFTGLSDENFSTIWDIYLNWMHERITEEGVKTILAEINARFP